MPIGAQVGKYRILKQVAEGGMGTVAIAEHVVLGQRVAIKFVLSDLVNEEGVVDRFMREAQAAAGLQSDFVARVFDVDRLDDGTPYMIMEYLEGEDLDDVIEASGPLPIHTAVDYTLQVLDALAEAHALGIIHRDLKPANLFLARRPDRTRRMKVLDFGISKVVQSRRSGGATTGTKSVLGSPSYMSPEQIESSKNVDQRTDIWSIGVVLYELLTAITLFDGPSVGVIFAKVLRDRPPPIGQLRPDLPAALADAIDKCLAFDRKDRFASAVQLMKALSPFASKHARMSMVHVIGDEAGEPVTLPRGDATLVSPTSARVSHAETELLIDPSRDNAGDALAPASGTLLSAHSTRVANSSDGRSRRQGGSITSLVWSERDEGQPRLKKGALALAALLLGGIGVAIWLSTGDAPTDGDPLVAPAATADTTARSPATSALPLQPTTVPVTTSSAPATSSSAAASASAPRQIPETQIPRFRPHVPRPRVPPKKGTSGLRLDERD